MTFIREPILHDEDDYAASKAATAVTGSAYLGRKAALPGYSWCSHFEDFLGAMTADENAVLCPSGWTAIIDTGATITAAAADGFPGGVIKITSDGTTEGASIYMPKGIQIGTRKWFMEARVQTEDADDTDVQIGLSIANATTNPEDLWTTAATDLIAFGVLDGDATVKSLIDKNNGGTSAVTGTIDLDDATWHTLGIEGDGANWVKFYVDGVLSHTDVVVATIPDDVNMVPFIGARVGADANHDVYCDYIRFGFTR